MPQSLSLEAIARSLAQSAPGSPLVYAPILASTQDTARSLALAGAPAGTVILADAQTAGRGTHGRSWITTPGSAILLSVLVPRPPEGTSGVWHTMVGGIAVVEAVRATCGIETALTWPNDVMLDGGKVAGVLTEALAGGLPAVLGIGINCAVPDVCLPPDAVPPAGLEQKVRRPLQRELLIVALLEGLAYWQSCIQAGDTALIHAHWSSALQTLRRRVALTLGDSVFTGTALDVDAHGALRILLDSGEERLFSSGRLREVANTVPAR